MSFQKSVLFLREDPPSDGGGGTLTPASSKGFYDNPDLPDDNVPPIPPVVPPVVPPPSEPPVTPPVTTPPVVPPAVPTPTLPVDWRKEVKAADHKEVLKELGYNDFAIDLLEYGKKTGDYTPYLEAKTVDYTKMTPEELVRLEIKIANPGMSEKALNFKINKELSDKYFTDRTAYPETSDEAEFGSEQLRLDGEKLRTQFIEKQQSFKPPESKVDTEAAEKAVQLQQQREQMGNLVLNNEVTVALKTAKSIAFGEGENSFNFPLPNIEQLVANVQSLLANSEHADLTGVDLKKLYKNLAINYDPDGFLDLYGKHMRALEFKKIQDELTNAAPPPDGSGTPPATPTGENKGFYDNIGKT